MTDFDADAADLRARWDAAAESGSLRPTAAEEAAMRRQVLAAISAGKPDAVSAPERPLALNQNDQGQHQQPSRRRWAFAASLAAAAVLVVSVMLRDASRDTSRDPNAVVMSGSSITSDPASASAPDDAMRAALEAAGSAPMRTALQLASREALPEFAVLDAAADELDAALARHPEDAELRAFRAALDARRDELTQRIRSVTE
jgi:hypothetical protein